MLALRLTRLIAVENIIKRFAMDIAQYDIQVLAKRHIAVAVDDEITQDALTSQSQFAITPLVIKCHEVKILLCLANTRRNLINKI